MSQSPAQTQLPVGRAAAPCRPTPTSGVIHVRAAQRSSTEPTDLLNTDLLLCFLWKALQAFRFLDIQQGDHTKLRTRLGSYISTSFVRSPFSESVCWMTTGGRRWLKYSEGRAVGQEKQRFQLRRTTPSRREDTERSLKLYEVRY